MSNDFKGSKSDTSATGWHTENEAPDRPPCGDEGVCPSENDAELYERHATSRDLTPLDLAILGSVACGSDTSIEALTEAVKASRRTVQRSVAKLQDCNRLVRQGGALRLASPASTPDPLSPAKGLPPDPKTPRDTDEDSKPRRGTYRASDGLPSASVSETLLVTHLQRDGLAYYRDPNGLGTLVCELAPHTPGEPDAEPDPQWSCDFILAPGLILELTARADRLPTLLAKTGYLQRHGWAVYTVHVTDLTVTGWAKAAPPLHKAVAEAWFEAAAVPRAAAMCLRANEPIPESVAVMVAHQAALLAYLDQHYPGDRGVRGKLRDLVSPAPAPASLDEDFRRLCEPGEPCVHRFNNYCREPHGGCGVVPYAPAIGFGNRPAPALVDLYVKIGKGCLDETRRLEALRIIRSEAEAPAKLEAVQAIWETELAARKAKAEAEAKAKAEAEGKNKDPQA